jgi:hypothetical protein
MSVRVLTWVWDHSASQGTDRLVLLALADSADDSGSCWPSMLTISRKAKVSERTARRAIRTLEDAGEVRSVRGGGMTSNRYRIMLDPRVQVVPDNPGQSDPPVNVTPGTDDRGGQSDPATKTGKGTQTSPVNVTGADTGDRGTVNRASKNKNSPPTEEAPKVSTDPRFVEFWDACPKKVGKADAFRRYQLTIRSGVSSAQVLEGIRRYALSVRDTDPKFIAHPATWLHQGRWDDETTAGKQADRPPGWQFG